MRACLKCQEYVIIHPDNYLSTQRVSQFEADHSRHTVVTMDLNEVKGVYKNIENVGKNNPLKVFEDG